MTCLGAKGLNMLLKTRDTIQSSALHYDSACDCLSAPEIFVVAGEGTAYPAYVITYSSY